MGRGPAPDRQKAQREKSTTTWYLQELHLPLSALLLVLLAAFTHSIWNLLAKRAASNPHFIWFTSIGESLFLLPLATWALSVSSRLDGRAGLCLISTGALELLYATSLLQGYRVADLSIVYPVARGTGSLLACLGAIAILRERSSFAVIAGSILVASGMCVLCLPAITRRRSWAGPCWGVFTGLTIAGYTLVDGYSIRVLILSPFLVGYAGNLFRTIALSGTAWRKRRLLMHEIRRCWREALAVAVLTPASYLLILFATRLAPVSHVAPAREISMLIGTYFGSRLLKEGHMARRLIGSMLVVAGVVALTLS